MGDFPVKERHSPLLAVWPSDFIVGNAWLACALTNYSGPKRRRLSFNFDRRCALESPGMRPGEAMVRRGGARVDGAPRRGGSRGRAADQERRLLAGIRWDAVRMADRPLGHQRRYHGVPVEGAERLRARSGRHPQHQAERRPLRARSARQRGDLVPHRGQDPHRQHRPSVDRSLPLADGGVPELPGHQGVRKGVAAGRAVGQDREVAGSPAVGAPRRWLQ